MDDATEAAGTGLGGREHPKLPGRQESGQVDAVARVPRHRKPGLIQHIRIHL